MYVLSKTLCGIKLYILERRNIQLLRFVTEKNEDWYEWKCVQAPAGTAEQEIKRMDQFPSTKIRELFCSCQG